MGTLPSLRVWRGRTLDYVAEPMLRLPILCVLTITLIPVSARAEGGPDFLHDVRPILASKCFKCHGPDEKARKGKLRLDVREDALKPAKSGKVAIVPGKPEESELIARLHTTDEDELMPPPASKIPLDAAQMETLKRWVADGAEYVPHWAFIAPQQSAPTPAPSGTRVVNPIDNFVLAGLAKDGLAQAPAADPLTLIRRVSLDLTGLPPTPEEADAFAADSSPDAYEKLVDRLLASPQYGERWARRWLDLARYADTNGYEKDRPRSIWPYRDWVINAINADMPFDQFTIEQIAGDLLPNATMEQKIATGFHRNTMLNEEGGIDPLEFRFYSMIDRVATTGTAWMGLTLGCAYCHTHKYDPIQQREFYSIMACLNNADEPEMDVLTKGQSARQHEIEAKIALLEAELPDKFPAVGEFNWQVAKGGTFQSERGASAVEQPDGAWLVPTAKAEVDTYLVTVPASGEVTAIRLEALMDPTLKNKGPGHTPHGNFVLSEVTLTADGSAESLKFAQVDADFSQAGFPASDAADGNPGTGWAIDAGDGKVGAHANHTWTARLLKPWKAPDTGGKLGIKLRQSHGSNHTLGRFRISLGAPAQQGESGVAARERKFKAWREEQRGQQVPWAVLRPTAMKTNLPLLTLQPDDSIFASGDQSKSDTYDLSFSTPLKNITALRLEVLPDDRLPKHGPGRVYYEGPAGDFTLCNVSITAGDSPVKIVSAAASFEAAGFTVDKTLDDNLQTGWSINGGQGRRHVAVFRFAQPIADASKLNLKLLFERHFCAGLGRFRISVTNDVKPAAASSIPDEVASLLVKPEAQISGEQRKRLLREFCLSAPELASARKEIDQLRKSLPTPTTTLVMTERPRDAVRATFIHNRGEFLQPTEQVSPGVPAILKPTGSEAPSDRLSFAKWLVSPNHPLTARVVVNRQWQAFFGRGLVRTMEDFGFQGEPPTHPALLDWLAVEFVKQGWSSKKLHKLIAMSATYRQSSQVSPQLLQKDPQNRLLARGPRFRVEAEMVRDSVLKASGLLSQRIGGPSVFPPQPAGVTTEGSYGALAWNVSTGEDRYRRALYTFTKRTTPYAMLATFDAPSGESCVAKRDNSNTPLQSLTMLNDVVILEAAQALAGEVLAESGEDGPRVARLFRRCLTRCPQPHEIEVLSTFLSRQRDRLVKGELKAKELAGSDKGDPNERAAWTTLARLVLNLEEMTTKQ